MANTQRLGVPGGNLAYDVTGDGPPLVLVHEAIADRRMWDDCLPAFAAHRRVIRYDMRGFGETVVTEDVPHSYRRDLIDLLDHLGIDRAAVVGASMAGQIMTDAAIEFPDRFAALVPVASGLSGGDFATTPEEDAADAEAGRLEEARDWEALVEAELRMWVDGLGQAPNRVAPSIRDRVREMDLAAYRAHADEPGDQVIRLRPPAAGRLGEIRAPTLVIVGDLDAPSTQASCRAIAHGVAGARLVVMEGVAHAMMMERPAEFAAIVESFLDEVGA
jgi:pimeloyl-ACP methyl ester carboxylesterase